MELVIRTIGLARAKIKIGLATSPSRRYQSPKPRQHATTAERYQNVDRKSAFLEVSD
jgi:hypothetical protein